MKLIGLVVALLLGQTPDSACAQTIGETSDFITKAMKECEYWRIGESKHGKLTGVDINTSSHSIELSSNPASTYDGHTVEFPFNGVKISTPYPNDFILLFECVKFRCISVTSKRNRRGTIVDQATQTIGTLELRCFDGYAQRLMKAHSHYLTLAPAIKKEPF